jgi:hypothetical protein
VQTRNTPVCQTRFEVIIIPNLIHSGLTAAPSKELSCHTYSHYRAPYRIFYIHDLIHVIIYIALYVSLQASFQALFIVIGANPKEKTVLICMHGPKCYQNNEFYRASFA